MLIDKFFRNYLIKDPLQNYTYRYIEGKEFIDIEYLTHNYLILCRIYIIDLNIIITDKQIRVDNPKYQYKGKKALIRIINYLNRQFQLFIKHNGKEI